VDEFLQKPEHFFSQGQVKNAMSRDINLYDNYILYVDAEFDRLISEMEATGALENTWVILTSDHGEMFERGIIGHTNPAIFAPLLHVPLFIFGPGVTQREDIFTPTSSLDLLPTLAQLAGRPIPDWAEGEVLPWFRTTPTNPDRSIYGINARHNDKFKRITHASISMLKGSYRLSAYLGYPELNGETRYELYNLANDPHELEDVYAVKKQIASEMVSELNDKLEEANRPYQS
jgi:arylsulfatase A-like enzyme